MVRQKNILKNNSGFTMTELLVAAVIGIVMMGLAISVFVSEENLLEDERDDTNVRGVGRFAIEVLAKELRLAGYGIHPSNAITSAQIGTITYRANTDDTSSLISANVSSGTNVSLRNSNGFTGGDDVIIYSPIDTTVSANFRTIDSISGNDLTLTSAINQSYETSDLAQVNRYHTIVIAYDAGADTVTKSVDGGTAVVIAGMVTAFTLSFEDETGTDLGNPVSSGDLDDIRKIKINFTLQDPTNSKATVSFDTEVNLRNMAS